MLAKDLGWGGQVPHLLCQWLLPAVLVQVGEQVDLGAIVLPQRYLQPNSIDDDLAKAAIQPCSVQHLRSHPALTHSMLEVPFAQQRTDTSPTTHAAWPPPHTPAA